MKRYTNLDGVENNKTLKDMRKWQKERKSKVKDLSVNIEQAPLKRIQEVNENRNKTSYTWIGHSTF